MDQALLDDIINRLLEIRGRPGKQVQLSESEIRQLCLVSKEIFLQQPNLLELEAPIKICGIFFTYFLNTQCFFCMVFMIHMFALTYFVELKFNFVTLRSIFWELILDLPLIFFFFGYYLGFYLLLTWN